MGLERGSVDIAYAYEQDAGDINTQSGRPLSVLEQFRKNGCSILPAFPLRTAGRYLYIWKYGYYRSRGKIYRPDREPRLLRNLARQVERKLRGKRVDCVFAPGSHVVTELDVPCPKIFCADATFANVLGFYDSFSNVAEEYLALGHEQERRALANCDAAIYPSDWAANSAISDYGAPPEKIHVIPFGANVTVHDPKTVHDWIMARPFDAMRVLFVGRDWKRKGGDTVLQTCEALRRQKLNLRLDIVGIRECPVELPHYATNHGLLDKNDPAERMQLERLLAEAHFFFVPSVAENYGMAFCEAAAYGVPSISTDVGGIATIVRDGITGYAFPLSAPPETYAEAMLSCFADPKVYRDVARSSFEIFQKELNWDVCGRRLLAVMESLHQSRA